MHGRLKVRTSAELEAINKKKQQEKADFYSSKMKIILEKRKLKKYDYELLSFTAEILNMNPDVSTLWNIRKKCILEIQKQQTEEIKSTTENELKLTEAALRINPKSYCAWHHRCWVLDNYAEEPNWEKELQICAKYLDLDERNFHCWDYRKYVVERHHTKLEEELEYSFQKLVSNFSNYSAWHYRSKLIPRIHSVFKREKLFQNDIYQQEVSLVENAVYTDPNDQSAWFYYRWLLGCISNPIKIVQGGYNQAECLAWVAIYPYVPGLYVKGLGNTEWEFLNGNKFSNVFVKETSMDHLQHDNVVTLYNKEQEPIDSVKIFIDKPTVTESVNFHTVLSPPEKDNLRKQLESYEKLNEMEPNNKWVLLTIVILKEKLDDEVEESVLDKLKLNDMYRKNYYSDLMSRHRIEAKLSTITNWSGTFFASNMSLTAFYHNYFFSHFEEIDLSNNPLGNKVIKKLNVLLSCKMLKLSDCQLTCIDPFPYLPNLRTLDISYNKIQFNTFPVGLIKSHSLQLLNVVGTSIDLEKCGDLLKTRSLLQIKF